MALTRTTLAAALAAGENIANITAAGTCAVGMKARINSEQVRVLAITGTSVTLARGLDGSKQVAQNAKSPFSYGSALDFASVDFGPIAIGGRDYTDSALVYTYGAAGAIYPHAGTHQLVTGAASAMTLADPSVAEDGLTLTIVALDAQAYTLTNTTGYGAGGASLDVATWGGAVGDSLMIEATGGKWHVINAINVTLG